MTKLVIVGEMKYDGELDKAIDLLDVDGVCYPNTPADVGKERYVVLQYGNLTDGHMDIVDAAIELGVPVLEYK